MTVPVVHFVVAGQEVDCAETGHPYTVVYDGACKVCNRIVKGLRKWDRNNQLEIIASQNSCVRARFPWIPSRAYSESVQLIAAGGRTWQGAAAVEKIIDLMPRGRLLTWIFSIPFARPIAERFYRWFARNRYQLGCGEHCQYSRLAVEFGDEE
jgi:predicted DCC family thiol-disulfide oxidoreductase YuxK